jgi:hypothetical protein
MGAALSAKLTKQVAAGDEILHRLSQIAMAARPSNPEAAAAGDAALPAGVAAAPKASAKALLAAAQAFSERRRATGLAA